METKIGTARIDKKYVKDGKVKMIVGTTVVSSFCIYEPKYMQSAINVLTGKNKARFVQVSASSWVSVGHIIYWSYDSFRVDQTSQKPIIGAGQPSYVG